MYDELVRQMRACCNGEPCEEANCGFNPKSDLDCIEQLLAKAADAIEELSEQLENETEYATALNSYVPQWIPLTDKENLPNTDSGVVGYFGGGADNQLRWYDFVHTLSDGTLVAESSERNVLNEHCIAVFKLPEPPKEES